MQMRITSSFAAKAVAAAALVALGDWLFWTGGGLGSNLGIFALAWTIATLALTPAAWRDRRSLIAAGAALLLVLILADRPGLLGWSLFWTALSMAALLHRFAGFDHAGRWALRLALHAATSMIGPWRDLLRMRRHLGKGPRMRSLLPLLPLPLLGGAVFLALFASANPVIGDAIAGIGLLRLDFAAGVRCVLWGILLTMVWGTFRPHRIALPFTERGPEPALALPGVSTASVLLALLVFNALFALQNGLDIAFLWSGAALPAGVTLADYAHRGAYPLIATALLAGLFVLVALRPGSATAAVPAIRRLVTLWIVQNVFLVASSMLRTLDYIQVYSLTELRIAALIWMALVAVGLVLIVWRMLTAKSGAWLINTNVAATLLVLTGCSAVDLGSVAAAWNVRHAREAGGQGAAIDLCYLRELGPSALVSLVTLERRGGFAPEFAGRLAWVRDWALAETLDGQRDGWWTRRDARRLREVEILLAGGKFPALPDDGPSGRGCDGAMLPPPPPPAEPAPVAVNPAEPVDPAPLTNGAGQ